MLLPGTDFLWWLGNHGVKEAYLLRAVVWCGRGSLPPAPGLGESPGGAVGAAAFHGSAAQTIPSRLLTLGAGRSHAARRHAVLPPGTQLSVPPTAKSADPSALWGTQAQSQVYGGVTYYNTVQQQVQPKPSPPRRTSQPVTIKPPPPEVPSPQRESVHVARYRRGACGAAASLSHPKSTLFRGNLKLSDL